ncbi:cytochrome c oxidase subunit II [Xaviernesmea oryzae]|uniref:cytochrome-c oxidase n=1 Tax=Xaviernesmea oryzae TaxID=464029 RepID=A0A1Q9ARC6_9HYPH|nr:cytochrome c oxidase subunit II [Xaviernesmea oryzae]OLP57929.1 cytochrome c oxidase subunit II [Xaviernesmea oryzae]SEL30416.1 cytochrome c oxidase subunit 2 [Xaviernesmea oryzae]
MIPRASLFLLLLLLTGCTNPQSALNAEGSSALALKDLILLIVLVCTLIWLAVVGFLLWSLTRRREAARQDPQTERRMRRSVYTALAITALIVAGLTLASFNATRHLDAGEGPEVVIRVKAQQWWWQFTYPNADGEPAFQSANELHIPVGRRIRLELEALDVVHSLWIPSLAGKLDMIPGRKNILTLQALRPGTYRGQCAEFCGLQHSHMAFAVVAETAADYQRWWLAQAAPASLPQTEEARAGQAVFMAKPCAACHTIRGTEARGSTGPDLTHVGSRATIGAGLLERTRGSLAAWIADPQTLKPGNNMPLVPLSSDELRQVSAYLDALK